MEDLPAGKTGQSQRNRWLVDPVEVEFFLFSKSLCGHSPCLESQTSKFSDHSDLEFWEHYGSDGHMESVPFDDLVSCLSDDDECWVFVYHCHSDGVNDLVFSQYWSGLECWTQLGDVAFEHWGKIGSECIW